MDTPASAPPSVLDLTQRIGAAAVPIGYEVWGDGVYLVTEGAQDLSATASPSRYLPPAAAMERKRIATRPLWICGLGHTIDTDEPLLQLAYGTVDGRIATMWLGRGMVTEHYKLQQLGAQGVPVDSITVRDVLAYLRESEAINARALPHLLVGHRTSPYVLPGGRHGWLLGRQWIGPEGSFLQSDPRENTRYMAALQPHGDRDYWYTWWRHLYESRWVNRALIASSFAAPLLRVLGVRTFFLHHWGDSSSGKTAILYFGQSVWGNPEGLYSSMNSTEVALTEIFAHLTDLPVAYDEKQVATIEIPQLIYSVCLPTGRERGAKDGGLRTDRQSWLTIARTTGEVPLVGRDDVGGQSNRVLQVHSPAFDTQVAAEKVYPAVRHSYGHAGPDFLRHLSALLCAPEGPQTLRSQFAWVRQALAERVQRDGNHTVYASVIALGGALAAHWLLDIPFEQAVATALDDAAHVLRETSPETRLPYADRALNLLRDHWLANPMMYGNAINDQTRQRLVDDDLRMPRLIGVEAPTGMAYIPTEADRVLRDARFSPERVWRDFAERGWIYLPPAGSTALTVQVPLRGDRSPRHPCYYIKAEVFFPGRWNREAPASDVPTAQPPLRLVREG